MEKFYFDELFYRYEDNIINIYFVNKHIKTALMYNGALFRIEESITIPKLNKFLIDIKSTERLSVDDIRENEDFDIYVFLSNLTLLKIHFVPEGSSVVQTISVFEKNKFAYNDMFLDFNNSVLFHTEGKYGK